MSYSSEEVRVWLSNCATRMTASSAELNALDAKLGDGDLGATLEKCGKLMQISLTDQRGTPSDHFKACAMACSRASGSSFGTLMAVAFMTLAKETDGRDTIEANEVADYIDTVNKALLTRGRSNLGDKTALDSLEAIRSQFLVSVDTINLHEVAHRAAAKAIKDFRGLPNKIGRARMFADKSIGLEDPGMVAVLRIIGPLDG